MSHAQHFVLKSSQMQQWERFNARIQEKSAILCGFTRVLASLCSPAEITQVKFNHFDLRLNGPFVTSG